MVISIINSLASCTVSNHVHIQNQTLIISDKVNKLHTATSLVRWRHDWEEDSVNAAARYTAVGQWKHSHRLQLCQDTAIIGKLIHALVNTQ